MKVVIIRNLVIIITHHRILFFQKPRNVNTCDVRFCNIIKVFLKIAQAWVSNQSRAL